MTGDGVNDARRCKGDIGVAWAAWNEVAGRRDIVLATTLGSTWRIREGRVTESGGSTISSHTAR